VLSWHNDINANIYAAQHYYCFSIDDVVGDHDHLRLVLDHENRVGLVGSRSSRSFIRSISWGGGR
jgi:hypothetical protein